MFINISVKFVYWFITKVITLISLMKYFMIEMKFTATNNSQKIAMIFTINVDIFVLLPTNLLKITKIWLILRLVEFGDYWQLSLSSKFTIRLQCGYLIQNKRLRWKTESANERLTAKSVFIIIQTHKHTIRIEALISASSFVWLSK